MLLQCNVVTKWHSIAKVCEGSSSIRLQASKVEVSCLISKNGLGFPGTSELSWRDMASQLQKGSCSTGGVGHIHAPHQTHRRIRSLTSVISVLCEVQKFGNMHLNLNSAAQDYRLGNVTRLLGTVPVAVKVP